VRRTAPRQYYNGLARRPRLELRPWKRHITCACHFELPASRTQLLVYCSTTSLHHASNSLSGNCNHLSSKGRQSLVTYPVFYSTIGSRSQSHQSSARLQRNHSPHIQTLYPPYKRFSYTASFTTWRNTAMDRTRSTAVETRKTSNSTRLRSRISPSLDTRRLFRQDMGHRQLRRTRRNMERGSAHRESAGRWAWARRGCGQDGLRHLAQRGM
jgi:hypothetical protein